ncbi:nucleotidyltransferase family protein [Proteiniclasticum ruminis]|uniref:MobA-like NTP transferase domain-containing protein n=1 Tax=Proteiniclasticum ruminis TaxID=398199 RepID=A0A1I5BX79_9CLOT|nr:NTP transferase domain-containing protein [Proteiniclasticum ruminis]SFN79338.1 MobA-like NTP transferase domain-containing protein [Proteiniclasticum ruminis]
MHKTLIFMAAGMGKRFGGNKQLAELGPMGQSLMEYTAYDAVRLGIDKLVFVLREDMEEAFLETLGHRLQGKVPFELVFQKEEDLPIKMPVKITREKPWGTGQCLYAAREAIEEGFLILNADDFYGRSVLSDLMEALEEGEVLAIPGYPVKNTLSEEGAVSRGVLKLNEMDQVVEIRERERIFMEKGQLYYEEHGIHPMTGVELVSMNIWAGQKSMLKHLPEVFQVFLETPGRDLSKEEFYLPLAMEALLKMEEIPLKVLPVTEEWMGVTYKEDRERVMERLKALTESGVYPKVLF